MKDLKAKKSVLQDILKMCNEAELEPLKPKKAVSIEVEAEPASEEGDEASQSMSDKVAELVSKNGQEEPKEDMDEGMKAALMELYAKLDK